MLFFRWLARCHARQGKGPPTVCEREIEREGEGERGGGGEPLPSAPPGPAPPAERPPKKGGQTRQASSTSSAQRAAIPTTPRSRSWTWSKRPSKVEHGQCVVSHSRTKSSYHKLRDILISPVAWPTWTDHSTYMFALFDIM